MSIDTESLSPYNSNSQTIFIVKFATRVMRIKLGYYKKIKNQNSWFLPILAIVKCENEKKSS